MSKRFLTLAMSITLLAIPSMTLANKDGNGPAYGHGTMFGGGILHEYHSIAAAQHNCPNDSIVWLNIRTGLWYIKGEQFFGSTRQGAYVCEHEALKAGHGAARPGK